MKATTWSLVAILCACPRAASAQTEAEGATTIDAYLARVAAVSLVRASAEVGVDVERARVALAGARPTPRIEAGLLQVDVSGEHAPTSSYLGLTMPIELGARGRRMDYARANAEVAAADVDALRLAMHRDAALAFVAALEADALLAIEQRTLEGYERVAEATARRLARGAATRGEQLDAELVAARARVRAVSARRQAEQHHVELARYLGEDAAPVVATGPLDTTARTFDEDTLVERALAQRPDLRAIDGALVRADAEARLARSGRVPTVDLTVSWTHNGQTDEPQFAQNANDTLSVLVGVPLPGPGRRSGNASLAVADRARWTEVRARRRTEATVEVRVALARYRASLEELTAYTTTIAASAQARREVADRTFDAGETTLVDRLAVEQRLYEIALETLRAGAEHHRALVRLSAAIGALER